MRNVWDSGLNNVQNNTHPWKRLKAKKLGETARKMRCPGSQGKNYFLKMANDHVDLEGMIRFTGKRTRKLLVGLLRDV